jgi:two-component system, NarL family, response regulator EvgA
MTTVLIVDDHPAFRLVVKTHLSQLLGVFDVFEAENGQSAVEIARQETPDVAILDLDIPRINGLEVIPRLKLAHPDIRVLVLSGQNAVTFAPRAMRSGAQGFIAKSQEMKEIMRGVEAVMAGYTVFPMSAGGAAMALSGSDNDEAEKLKQLSDKELMILQMLAKGMSNKIIGEALFMSDKTVSTYKSRVQEKLGLSSLASLIEYATLQKLID